MAGVEEIPEHSGQKRALPALRSAGDEWAGEWPAGLSALWVPLGVRQWWIQRGVTRQPAVGVHVDSV